jgi:hypothetical protein
VQCKSFGDYNGDLGDPYNIERMPRIEKGPGKITEVGYNQCHVKHSSFPREKACVMQQASKQPSSGVAFFSSFFSFQAAVSASCA